MQRPHANCARYSRARLGAVVCWAVPDRFHGTLTYYLAPIMLRPEENSAGSSSFSGTLLQAQLVLGLFGLVIVFGVGSAVNGLWQVATGRRNRWITMIMLGLIGVFLIAEVVIRIVLDG